MAVGSSNDFDLIILGAGTGGYAAAFRGAQLGLRVALVDEDKIGGTCLHRGCIPTKAMLESAAVAERIRHAADFGLRLPGAAEVDFAQIAKRRDQIVNRMWKGLGSLVKKNNVTWIQGRGRLEGPTKVRVSLAGEDGTPGAGGERVLNGTDVVLATGSRVKSLPGIVPDGDADRDQGRHAQVHDDAGQHHRHRRRGGRGRVRIACTTTSARRSRCSSTCRPSSRSRTARSAGSWSAASPGAGSRS